MLPASGSSKRIDAELVVPDPKLTLRRGAIAPWAKSTSPYYQQTLEALGRHFKFRLDVAFEKLPLQVQQTVLYGSGRETIRFSYEDGVRAYDVNKPFEGVVRNLERRFKETDSESIREDIGRFMSATPCEACGGTRLRPEARAVKIDGLHVSQVTAKSVSRSLCLVRRSA